MEIIRTNEFNAALQKLPKEIQNLYHTQEVRFRTNWRDSRLHLKKVKGLLYAFSFRITRRYRVFFYFQNSDTAIFFDVDHRKDIYH